MAYQLNAERLRQANPEAMMLHPGPMNRGVEISPEVADGPQSCVLEQVTNGIAVRMALLFLLMSGGAEEGGNPLAESEPNGRTVTPRKRNPPMLLIKNGRVLDPASKADAALDIFSTERRLPRWARRGKSRARKTLKFLTPAG